MSIEQKDAGYLSLKDTNDLNAYSGFPVSYRLRLLQKLLKIKSVSAFASEIGVDASVLNNIMSPYGRKGKPSFDTLEKIAATYSRVNIEWLVTGRGEPLRPFGAGPETHEPQNLAHVKESYANENQPECASDYVGAISELRTLLKICLAEKEGLEKLLAVKDDLINLLKDRK
jgi:hypothetical protein